GLGGAAGSVIGREVAGGGKQQPAQAQPAAAAPRTVVVHERRAKDDCWNHPKMKSKAWAAKGC
ncbi:MAG TPA: hypothetical protein VM489_04660, partial [Burkholderiales bacterium]|nr:hypothetical protein [Burkholderiales bacterium]